ncbi:gag-proteinase polyprotein [Cucumis melo var. makuwa]|uniref:Gag-proteinase polyprotein n=1 Tax=Cucumis melo var. makuwa TaxID=1194695 RepID=A0A5D3C3U0_CUCMM|nr:gag-proteinase polyprotein [Cucumis melo var. makuwa]TYK05049.1 gag-proteinase polyprotein [Cucumis melo var. makuwa]
MEKNYSYWKPRMIFFIKTLHGKAWRALVAGYESPMVTMDGVSVPKPEVDWTDAEEQASVGNARAINAIFNALKVTEDELVSKYNERVLEITNGSLLLGEKISESKIVRKVLCCLPRNFDMKVIAIEEVQDIATLKLELFGSLLTFEIAMSNRESKKCKGIAFKSVYEQETTVNEFDNEVNQDESIALLTKQFSKMAKKFKSMNTAGTTVKTGRHAGEYSTRKVNDFSYKRNSDHGKKKKDVGRSCRECEGFGHYQAEYPTYLRRQKNNYYAILSDEYTNDDEVDHGMNVFTACITEINSKDDS